jgi:cell wall-associated NlpC family hydrolase
MSSHRKIDRKKIERAVRRSGALLAPGAVLGTGVALAVDQGTAEAASVSTWDKVAACESSNNWSINTGNGYFGGLQFTASTWAAYGGTQYAPQANQATKAQQIAIAEKVLASQGPGAWPVCSVRAGLTAGGPAPHLNTAPRTTTPRAAPVPTTTQASMAAAYALAKLGSPYIYGATGPHAFDCSGLTQAAWRAAGVSIPRTSEAQWSHLPRVSSPRVGDLIVYRGGGHVAIYVGNGKIVEAPSPGKSVHTAPWRSGWYADHFTGIVRPLSHTVSTQEGPTAHVPKSSGHTSSTPPKSGGVSTYTVQRGDWLSKISARYNLKGGWERLYALNKSVVGDDPNLIFPGQVLHLK